MAVRTVPNLRRWVMVSALALSFLSGSLTRSSHAAPANPAATAKAQQVLEYLASLPKLSTQRVLAGQNVGHGVKTVDGYKQFVTTLQSQTGKAIALLGVDYGLSVDSSAISTANQVIKSHWAAGGLATISIHFPNPFTGGDAWDRSGVDLAKLVAPGSAAYTQWMGHLDKVATGLAELRDAGVVVLWRPFHEMNGDWFWWSSKGGSFATPAEFDKLWRQMFEYFTKVKGLNNLLWVYAPNVQTNTSAVKATTYFYPGSDVVDVVGLDAYLDNLSAINSNQSVSSLVALGKPFGLTEFGPKTILDGSFDATTVLKGIKSYAPQATFWLQWHSWSGAAMAIVDCQNAAAVMSDPWVITRDKILLPAPAPAAKDAGLPLAKDSGLPAAKKEAGLPLAKDAGPAPSKDSALSKDTVPAPKKDLSGKEGGTLAKDAGKIDLAKTGDAPRPLEPGLDSGARPADAGAADAQPARGDAGAADDGGCNAGGSPPGFPGLLAALGLLLVPRRRRR